MGCGAGLGFHQTHGIKVYHRVRARLRPMNCKGNLSAIQPKTARTRARNATLLQCWREDLSGGYVVFNDINKLANGHSLENFTSV
jgi:hypothetical protein